MYKNYNVNVSSNIEATSKENINSNVYLGRNIKEMWESRFGKFKILSNIFEKRNTALYIVSLMLSLVGLDGGYSIFAISMLAACFSAGVPAIGVVIVSLIGTIFAYGVNGGLLYFLSALVLVMSMLIFKQKFN